MQIKDSFPAVAQRLVSEVAVTRDQMGWRWMLRTLWRRKWSILLPALALAALAALVVARIPPTYQGRAEVFVDPRQAATGNPHAAAGGMPDAQTLTSQVRVLQSRNLAYKAVEALELDEDPEFNVTLQPPGVFERAENWLRAKLAAGGVAADAGPDGDAAPEAPIVAAGIVDRFLSALHVELLADSRVLAVTFDSHSPERAAQAANKLAEMYILDQLDAKYDATQRATSWLTDKIAELRRNVASAEQAVEKFRSQSGLLQGTGGTMATQQASDLSAQLLVVRNARTEAEQRLTRLRQAGRSAGGAADVGRSPAVQQLLDQQTQVKRKLADLAKEYGDRHPQMIAARAELADLEAKTQRELDRGVNTLESEVAAARAREASLARSLDQLRGKLGQSANAEIQLRSLERDAEASRSMLETFLARFEQATAQLDTSINEMDARIISRADVPTSPTFPPVMRIVVLTFFLAALLATLVVFVLEQLDRGFRSGEQIEKETGLRSLGLVPAIRSSGSGKGPASHLLRHPSSMFGESIRSLYTGILLSPDVAPPRKLLVTSSQPKEGKTTISVCLGRMRALAGHPTVMIEADLRRPSMHRALGVSRGPGLTEVVLGEKELDDVLQRDPESGAWFVLAGKLAPDPTEILSSAKMTQILEELARRFELVVVDSPPLVAVSDSRLLARQVDAAVLVVRWARTPRDVVRLAVKQLQEARTHISGVVVSMVDPRKHAQYGFGDSAYYYGPVKRYYTS